MKQVDRSNNGRGLQAKDNTGGESDLRITDQKEKHLKDENYINWTIKTGNTQEKKCYFQQGRRQNTRSQNSEMNMLLKSKIGKMFMREANKIQQICN